MLVICERPTGTIVRLAIWIGVVFIFYLIVLGDTALTGERSPADSSPGWHEWLLLLFPLFLLPYLFSLARALLRADELTFDGPSGMLSNRRETLAAFADIRELQLQTVHGTCEEFCLRAILVGGRSIKLIESKASPAIAELVAEISDLVGVEITRTA